MPNVEMDQRFARSAKKLLRKHPDKRARVDKALAQLAEDPRHPGLATKKYDASRNIWQSYIEQNTPGAWRLWWVWGPTPDTIVVISFGPHP